MTPNNLRGPYNRGYLAARRFFGGKRRYKTKDGRDPKIFILFLDPGRLISRLSRHFHIISRLSCIPVTPVILNDRGTRQPRYKTF